MQNSFLHMRISWGDVYDLVKSILNDVLHSQLQVFSCTLVKMEQQLWVGGHLVLQGSSRQLCLRRDSTSITLREASSSPASPSPHHLPQAHPRPHLTTTATPRDPPSKPLPFPPQGLTTDSSSVMIIDRQYCHVEEVIAQCENEE